MKTKIPQTKNEAFDLLDMMLSEKYKNELVKGDAIMQLYIHRRARF